MAREFVKYIFLLGLALLNLASVNGLAIMSLDIGNEWVKIAIVSPGKPMEIILNSDSSRKTPLSVAFRDGQRFFGEAALSTNLRFPEKSFDYLLDLIGKPIDDPIVKTYSERFPFRSISTNSTTNEDGSVVTNLILNHPDGLQFTPEELLAMIIEKCISYAENAVSDSNSGKISEGVITVPPYFSQEELQSVKRAAALAGLRVIEVLNSDTAVALNYGIFNTADLKEGDQLNVLFFDMGATSTIASVASYHLHVEGKEKTPILTMKGFSADRSLGGLEMQIRLRDHLAEKFSQLSSIPLEKIRSTKRAMSKLMKEAARVKKVLSANTEIMAQVENVMNDKDLRVAVSRVEFEALCADILSPQRIFKPISDAIAASGLKIEDINSVVLFGGNTRIPKVQEALANNLNGKELSKSINTDESAALGAAFRAASLSKGFKVRKFNVTELNDETTETATSGDASTTEESSDSSSPTAEEILVNSPSFKESKAKLLELKRKDDERNKRDSLLNQVESYITETRMKLEEDEYRGASTEEEREAILNHMTTIAEWLESDSYTASVADLQGKLRSLKSSTKQLFNRVKELRRLKSRLAAAAAAAAAAANSTTQKESSTFPVCTRTSFLLPPEREELRPDQCPKLP